MTWQAAYTRWRPEFAKIADEIRYPMSWLDEQVASGAVLFVYNDDAAIVAEMLTYPSGARDIHGLAAVGSVHAIQNELIPMAEGIGRDLGAIGAIISSREGWSRVLKDQGYAPYQVSVRKAL